MSHLLITPLLVPLLAAIGIFWMRSQPQGARRHIARALSTLSVLYLNLVALLLISAVSGGQTLSYALGDWPAPFGIVLVADRLSASLVWLTALLSLAAIAVALRGYDARGRHFHALFQLQLFGLNGAFLTGDLFNLFVFFEVLLLASYGLLLHGGGAARTRAGLHFVVLNLLGSSLFLIAAGLFYGLLGTLNMADMARLVGTVGAAERGWVAAAGLLLLTVFALKGALLPLHPWLPNAYASASLPVAVLFAVMTKVGAYAILRVETLIFGPLAGPLAGLYQPWLLPLALLTLVAGILGALSSTRLALQVAYLVVGSAGTLLTAFALDSATGLSAGLYYLPHATFAAAILFLLVESVALRRGALGDRLAPGVRVADGPILGALFFVAAVLMAGLPPLSGFIGKWLLLRAALDHAQAAWVLAVVLSTSLLAMVALARSGSLVFYRGEGGDALPKSLPALGGELLALLWLLGLALLLLVAAPAFLDFTDATALQLLDPQHYIDAVLTPHVEVP